MSTIINMRKTEFANEEYYHIFNRGVDKREVFSCDNDYARFLKSMKEFNVIEPIGSIYEKYLLDKKMKWTSNVHDKNGHLMSKNQDKLVNVVCYCLNPNHYHLVLKQLENNGIAKFMQRLGNGYTKYYNHKYGRSGVLFQGVFKSVHISSNEQLLHVSAYVNLNFKVHQFKESANHLSSWHEYIGKTKIYFCNKESVLGQFKNKAEYKNFAEAALREIKIRKDYLKSLED